MIKKRTSIIMILTIAVAVGFIFTYFVNNNRELDSDLRVSELRPVDATSNLNFTVVSASELSLSDEQIIDMSEIIVKGKITKQLGEYDYYLDLENGETATIVRTLYEFDLKEILKGENIDELTLSCTGDFLPGNLELNREYVLCLYHVEGDYENAYTFVSLSQGNFISSDEEIKNAQKSISIDNFKKEIDKVKEKNENNIMIDTPLKKYDINN